MICLVEDNSRLLIFGQNKSVAVICRDRCPHGEDWSVYIHNIHEKRG